MAKAPNSIEWQGLKLTQPPGEEFYRFEPAKGERLTVGAWPSPVGWFARVGLGETPQPLKTPEEALDLALEEHLKQFQTKQGEFQELMAFGRALGVLEAKDPTKHACEKGFGGG